MTEKEEFSKALNEANEKYKLGWDYDYIYTMSSAMVQKLDEGRFLDKDEFNELLEHNYGNPEEYKGIDFNDEVASIEMVGEEELIDIEVSDDSLFYANGILTHNSAYGNVDAGLESVSDSIGLVQTADTFCFLINSDTMKEQNQVLLKFEKNRNTGQLNSLMLEVDYAHMRYTDFEEVEMSQQEMNGSIPEMAFDTGLDMGAFNFGN